MKKTIILGALALVMGCWGCQVDGLELTDGEDKVYAEAAAPDNPGGDEKLECPEPIECPAATNDGCNFDSGCGYLQALFGTAETLLDNCKTEGLPANHAWTSTYYTGGGPSLPPPTVVITDAGCQLWSNTLNDRKDQVVTAAQNLKINLPPAGSNGQWRIVGYDWDTPQYIIASPGNYYKHTIHIKYRWAISTVVDENPGELGPG